MINLAQKTIKIVDNDSSKFEFLYSENSSIKEKIEKIVTEIYG